MESFLIWFEYWGKIELENVSTDKFFPFYIFFHGILSDAKRIYFAISRLYIGDWISSTKKSTEN